MKINLWNMWNMRERDEQIRNNLKIHWKVLTDSNTSQTRSEKVRKRSAKNNEVVKRLDEHPTSSNTVRAKTEKGLKGSRQPRNGDTNHHKVRRGCDEFPTLWPNPYPQRAAKVRQVSETVRNTSRNVAPESKTRIRNKSKQNGKQLKNQIRLS